MLRYFERTMEPCTYHLEGTYICCCREQWCILYKFRGNLCDWFQYKSCRFYSLSVPCWLTRTQMILLFLRLHTFIRQIGQNMKLVQGNGPWNMPWVKSPSAYYRDLAHSWKLVLSRLSLGSTFLVLFVYSFLYMAFCMYIFACFFQHWLQLLK